MAGYRRFIAYVYEYRKGKKEDNCGFMKVEVRNHMCTIEPHLQVEGLAAGEVCKVYGFVRKEGLMNGILLGSCKTEANRIECLVETDGMDMGGSGIPLEKMGGMILLTESGGFFGTEWDDQTIRPENFKESIIKKEEVGAAREVIKEKAEEKQGNESPHELERIHENESKSESEKMSENADEPERTFRGENTDETERLAGAENAGGSELQDQEIKSIPSSGERHEAENGPEQIQDDQSEPKEMVSGGPQAEPDVHIQSTPPRDASFTLPFGQPFCPFTDGDLNQCWKITPQDLVHFPRRQCALRNNRFLQFGYYNFGHLLLCRRSNGRYILGVPGSYDQQEQFMAGMFGFSCFKESNCIKVKKGRGGYWYRAIDPPASC